MSPDVFVDGEALGEAMDRVFEGRDFEKPDDSDMADVLSEYQKIVAGKNDKS